MDEKEKQYREKIKNEMVIDFLTAGGRDNSPGNLGFSGVRVGKATEIDKKEQSKFIVSRHDIYKDCDNPDISVEDILAKQEEFEKGYQVPELISNREDRYAWYIESCADLLQERKERICYIGVSGGLKEEIRVAFLSEEGKGNELISMLESYNSLQNEQSKMQIRKALKPLVAEFGRKQLESSIEKYKATASDAPSLRQMGTKPPSDLERL